MQETQTTEERLERLRSKLIRIRAAKALADDYLLTVGGSRRQGILGFINWLNQQEKQVIRLGKDIKYNQQRLSGM